MAQPQGSPASFMIGASGCVLGDDRFGLFASYATPVGANGAHLQLDAQLEDGGAGGLRGEVTAQAYRRVAGQGLYGVFAGYQASDSTARDDGLRAGGVAELYAGQMTFSGKLGWDFANQDALGEVRISGYPGANTRLYAGYAYDGEGFAFLGAEHMVSSRLSVFGEAISGDAGDAGRLGLKLHFGGKAAQGGAAGADRTLISRDRDEFLPLWMQPCVAEPDAVTPTTAVPQPTITTTSGPPAPPQSPQP